MGRQRKLDDSVAVPAARTVFTERGYSGTSIDELTNRTGMLRGSLYAAFGSKMGLFRRCASDVVANLDLNSSEAIHFLIVALKDVGSDDPAIEEYCATHIHALGPNPAHKLGNVLLSNIKEKS